MCGLRGTVPVDFSLSLTRFIQQMSNISRLVGLIHDTLQAMAITAHLLEATAPGNFLHSPLQVSVVLAMYICSVHLHWMFTHILTHDIRRFTWI